MRHPRHVLEVGGGKILGGGRERVGRRRDRKRVWWKKREGRKEWV